MWSLNIEWYALDILIWVLDVRGHCNFIEI